MSLEPKIIDNVQKLTWNFEEVKKKLSDDIKKYTELVVSETNLKEMEGTQKEIASLRVKLGKFKLAVKKDLNKPYEVFELQVNELAKLIESAERPIKDQLDKYEIKRKDLKRVEIKEIITNTASELMLEEKYRDQIIIDEKWMNRGSKIKDIKEEIQMRVVYFLEQQRTDKEAETFHQQKIEMAKIMVDTMSVGLVTPLTFAEIESKISQLNIAELKTYIETLVSGRKEREEKVKQAALERAEQERVAEVARQEKIEQARIAEVERQTRIEEAHKVQLAHIAEQVIETVPVMTPTMSPATVTEVKKYNAQFVAYGVNAEQVEKIRSFISGMNVEFKHAVKEVVVEEEVDY